MGKAEGHLDEWHGHVTALTVSPDYRRLGLAVQLMNFLEDVSEKYETCTQVTIVFCLINQLMVFFLSLFFSFFFLLLM